jgi:superfamily II DNA/RNA helicase
VDRFQEQNRPFTHEVGRARYTAPDVDRYDTKQKTDTKNTIVEEKGHEAFWLRRPFFMRDGGSNPTMQLVETPMDSEPETTTRRPTRRARVSVGDRAPEQAAAPETPEITGPKRRTRKSVATVASPATATAEAAPEIAPKRRTRKKSAAPAETLAAIEPVMVTPAAPVEEMAEPTVEAAPKRRTRKKTETIVEQAVAAAGASASPVVEPLAAPAEPVATAAEAPAAPKRRTRKKSESVVETAVAAASAALAQPEVTAAEVVVPEAATSLPEAAAPKRRRTRKVAEVAAVAAPETVAVAPEVEAAPQADEWSADFVPTITRVRTDRRGARKVISEKVLEPGELRRRRRERRERLAAGLESGTPSPLAGPAQYVTAFGGLTMTSQTAQALADMKYETPTEIQAKAIPLLLEGKDVVGQAQTGTGKTAAFGIPLAERIDPSMLVVQALVLAPTRELASQISAEVGKIGRKRGIRVAAIYGGASMGAQLSELKRGAQVVVGTPGRILDHLKRGTLSFESVSFLVLDEADRMLDMGFMPDVERILRRTPRNRQTAMFSATVPTVVRIISRRHMRDAVTVQVKPEERTVTTIDQIFYEVAERDKPEALRAVLAEQKPERAMVFCRTQIAVDRLTRILRRDGIAVEAIHGSLGQGQRERVLADFRRGAVTLLIATNLAARGLDIPEVSHVINYDIPEESESYVHRIGRTARMGREGVAITFVAEWDEKSLAEIKKVANGALRQERLSLYA